MRARRVQKKKLEKVIVPNKLIKFFKWIIIEINNKEEYTQIESDDLMQDTSVYGGLLKKGRDTYRFRYFPNQNSVKYGWDLKLSTKELESIAKGKTQTLNLWACQQKGCQNKSMDKSYTCDHHDYYDDGKPDPFRKTPEEIEESMKEKKRLFEKWKKQNP